MYIYICMYICVCTHSYMYLYIYRERQIQTKLVGTHVFDSLSEMPSGQSSCLCLLAMLTVSREKATLHFFCMPLTNPTEINTLTFLEPGN